MIKKVFLLLMLLSSSKIVEANQLNPSVAKIVEELKSFIDTVKPMTLFNGKYSVYVLKHNAEVKCKKSEKKSFTISYITNDFDMEYIYPNYYFMVDSELVLLDIKDSIMFSQLNSLGLNKIDSSIVKSLILKKLTNHEERTIRGTPESEVFTIEGDSLTKIFYKDSDQMPKEQSIFDIDKIMNGIEFREVPHPELPSDHPKNQMR